MSQALIFGGVRSARARAKEGAGLNGVTPQELLTQFYSALCERTGLSPESVDDVLLGCVTQHGEQAGNIAKASTLYAGWPSSVPGLTVNRYCSSGVDAVALAALKIQGGVARQVIAGGVEMMSRIPMLADEARVFKDPAFAARCRMLMMGSGADLLASRAGVSREQADQVAFDSQQRATKAQAEGRFAASLVPIRTPTGEVFEDECIRPETTRSKVSRRFPLRSQT